MEESTRKLLSELKIASPCPMLWTEMEVTAEQAVRFCGECKKNVYDVSAMSAQEASMLVQREGVRGGSACVQLYRRADGTIITDDCPVGLRRVRDFWRRVKSTAAAIATLIVATMPAWAQDNSGKSATIKGGVNAERQPAELGRQAPMLMGGAPAPVNWRGLAMEKPSVKKIGDQVDQLTRHGLKTDQDKIKVLNLRLEMAREAEKAKVPAFAYQELSEISIEAQTLVDQSSAADRREKVDLLRAILTANKASYKSMGMTDTTTIDAKLKKLDSLK